MLAEARVRASLERIAAYADPATWITRVPPEVLLALAQGLDALDPGTREKMPLFGVPFAVKDNIDVAGLPTTAGCPAFAYVPQRSATVVERLQNAGAILIGKTNLDQFATGLVGTRSPYGAPRNPYDAQMIPGGSSSGSAVAVASGMVTFALGTDTAGSGRIPCGFTNTVGVKPTRGLISAFGVVPACRTLDCVSIIASELADAAAVLAVAAAYDPRDPLSRTAPVPARGRNPMRIGVPFAEQRLFLDDETGLLFEAAVARFERAGHPIVPFDYGPFAETAKLLYGDAFVAERTAALGEFIAAHPDDVLPVTRDIILGGAKYSAAAAFTALERRDVLAARARAVWEDVDAILLPTAPGALRLADVEAAPLETSAMLGTYTNFVNLFDLCALAIPNAFTAGGFPVGMTLIAPAFHEERLFALAKAA